MSAEIMTHKTGQGWSVGMGTLLVWDKHKQHYDSCFVRYHSWAYQNGPGLAFKSIIEDPARLQTALEYCNFDIDLQDAKVAAVNLDPDPSRDDTADRFCEQFLADQGKVDDLDLAYCNLVLHPEGIAIADELLGHDINPGQMYLSQLPLITSVLLGTAQRPMVGNRAQRRAAKGRKRR